jgi:competence protein ComEC
METLRLPLIASIITLIFLTLFVIFASHKDVPMLEVSFFDVGQGDAIFIESPAGTQVLVDGGKGDIVLTRLRERMGFFDRDIDLLVATHPDMDHIGGLIDVLERYVVDAILLTNNESDTETYALFMERVKSEGTLVYYAQRGDRYDIGGETYMDILFPLGDVREGESNETSIVAQVRHRDNTVLLTGDAPRAVETYLVSTTHASLLQSDILKLGHHGSRTSSDETFLRTVRPMYAVVSAGKENIYGHPHKEVLARLASEHIPFLSTAEDGTISFLGDGELFMQVK